MLISMLYRLVLIDTVQWKSQRFRRCVDDSKGFWFVSKVKDNKCQTKQLLMLLLTFCLLLLPLRESVIVLCFVVRYFMSILVLQSSWWGRESWLLCLICLPGVLWWLSGSSSRCHGVVCSLWSWYFLIILIFSANICDALLFILIGPFLAKTYISKPYLFPYCIDNGNSKLKYF